MKKQLKKSMVKTRFVFLYEDIFCGEVSQNESNFHTVLEYKMVLDQAFLFSCSNFEEIINMSFNMTNLRSVIENKEHESKKTNNGLNRL